jgi:hypothetical protein
VPVDRLLRRGARGEESEGAGGAAHVAACGQKSVRCRPSPRESPSWRRVRGCHDIFGKSLKRTALPAVSA